MRFLTRKLYERNRLRPIMKNRVNMGEFLYYIMFRST
jgi:hypothetical protein